MNPGINCEAPDENDERKTLADGVGIADFPAADEFKSLEYRNALTHRG